MSHDNYNYNGNNPYQYWGSEAQVLGDQFRAQMKANDLAVRHSRDVNSAHDNGWNAAVDAMTPRFNQLLNHNQQLQARIAELERKVIAIADDRDEALVVIDRWADHSDRLKAKYRELRAEKEELAQRLKNAVREVEGLRSTLERANAYIKKTYRDIAYEKQFQSDQGHLELEHAAKVAHRQSVFQDSLAAAVRALVTGSDEHASQRFKETFSEAYQHQLEHAVKFQTATVPLHQDAFFREHSPELLEILMLLIDDEGAQDALLQEESWEITGTPDFNQAGAQREV